MNGRQESPQPEGDFFIASHVLTYGPAQALRDYLIPRAARVVFAASPFPGAEIPRAVATVYRHGERAAEHAGQAPRPEGWRGWLRDLRFVWRWGRRLCDRRTVFIGVNNLNALAGLGLRALGRCGCVVYYVIDYTPRRFPGWLQNRVYQCLARWVARRADLVWNLSEPMREVHVRRFGSRAEKNLIVPVGIDLAAVRPLPEQEIDPQRLVVVSTLFANKGVQLAIDALPDIPGGRLTIVGTGPFEGELRARARERGVADRVQFLGGFTEQPDQRRRLFAEIARSRVALAPYVPEEGSYSYYCDPSKPKEYLACGVPVVITRVPWIARLIAEKPMGMAIEYSAGELARACRRLMSDDAFWRRCRQEALAYAQTLDWAEIFSGAMESVRRFFTPAAPGDRAA